MLLMMLLLLMLLLLLLMMNMKLSSAAATLIGLPTKTRVCYREHPTPNNTTDFPH